jgi:hypothetical protein
MTKRSGLLSSFRIRGRAARFALSRYYREKVWERKAAAYTDIFDALHDMEQLFRTQIHNLTTQLVENSGPQLSDEEDAQLKSKYEVEPKDHLGPLLSILGEELSKSAGEPGSSVRARSVDGSPVIVPAWPATPIQLR